MAKKQLLEVVYRDVRKLKGYARNARTHSAEQIEVLKRLMEEFGWTTPLLIRQKVQVVAGHGRIMAARQLWDAGKEIDRTPAPYQVPTINVDGWSDAQMRAYILADNASAELAGWNDQVRALELAELQQAGYDLSLTAFPEADILALLTPEDTTSLLENARKSLADRFGIAPFSVLNAREGWWQDRKRAWLSLGIRSELGRGENLIQRSPQEVFCHATGIPYAKARKIVTEAMKAEGERFDLNALIVKHGGRKAPAGDFSGSGAVIDPGQPGGMTKGLLKKRAQQKERRKRADAASIKGAARDPDVYRRKDRKVGEEPKDDTGRSGQGERVAPEGEERLRGQEQDGDREEALQES
jgi:ParB-like chromosome segregation protein Spo0J